MWNAVSPLAMAIGAVAGIIAGYVCGRLPIAPLTQSIAAAILSSVLGSVARATLWFWHPPPHAEVLAVSFGLFESLLGLGAAVLGGAVLHFALGWAGTTIHPSLAAHRGAIIGLLAGVWGAATAPSGMGIARPLK
jgi:hypothetical protein